MTDTTQLGRNCHLLAMNLMFSRITPYDLKASMDNYGLQLRKNKGIPDINTAIAKGIKNGMSKTEFEIDMVALYLEKVVKLAK